MKRMIYVVSAFMCLTCVAQTTEYTPDVVALLKAKYWRDVSNEAGRIFWHGKPVRAIADPSNMVTYAVYEDGRIFKDKAKLVTPKEAIQKANKKLKKSVDTKGVPRKLAEARIRREEELNGASSNVTVNVIAGERQ